jgi:hypothetical protein
MGIDATMPEGIPKKLYQRATYYGKDKVRLEDFT